LATLQYVFNPSDKLAAASVITRYCNLFNNNSELPVVYPSGIFNTADVNKIITADFTEKCHQLRMENLYLLTVKLISLLGLDKFETEKVYIHSFLDLVFNYCTSELSDLSGFLKFWEDEGAKKAISAADSDTSVRILTIHKSKGLEFPIVIIPFADWDITPKSNEILWVEPNCPPFDTYELLPVNIAKSLDDTHFSNEYQLECYRSLIDNLNLLYVAFTRPKSALFVISRISEGTKNSMGDLISTSAIELFNDKNLNIIFTTETKTYEIPGTLVVRTESNSVQTSPISSDAQSTQIPPVRINYQSSEFIREKNNLLDPKSFGKILHLAMEGIKSSSDIDSSVLALVLQGIISTTESTQIKNTLRNAMENEKTKAWFSVGYTILNEADIIGSAGNIKRPDRIMIKDDTAIVVDYKFGKESDMGKHQNQVKQYMKLMSEMQFSSVKGFLWYVMENDVEEVFV
jgi:ATP-dependent exoDNAse (exonuclease V) beta subunit